jgi:iron-sulfur cluster repair protein YtfE (RIC family)
MGAISEFMGRDHERLDALLEELRAHPAAESAKELFARFDGGLRAHIAWEEEILFPAFEEKTGMRNMGPTAVMRMEHETIKQLLQAIAQAVEASAPTDSADTLAEVLSAHNLKEENVLYPALDQSLPAEEASVLLARIERAAELSRGAARRQR